MKEERSAFGVVSIGHKIYVAGGSGITRAYVPSVEVYNVLKDKWTTCIEWMLPDRHSQGLTCISIKKRYVFGFGGWDKENKSIGRGIDRFMRLDTLKPAGWQTLSLPNQECGSGIQYAVLPIGFVGLSIDKYEFIVFGGLKRDKDLIRRTYLFTTELSSFKQSSFTVFDGKMCYDLEDRTYYND
jgi:hypothetical protein